LIASEPSLASALKENWGRYDSFVFIMATGIVVRTIAPLLRSKTKDPAVVVVDETGRYAVSLLSGHLGGANTLAKGVAHVLGSEPVITTASDRLGLTAVDLWARQKNFVPDPPETLKKAASRLVNCGQLQVYLDTPGIELPDDFYQVTDPALADIVISNRTVFPDSFVLRPQNLAVGVGCNRGTTVEQFDQALRRLFLDHRLSLLSIRNLASIDLKRDEPGLIDFASSHGWEIRFYSKEELNSVENVAASRAVFTATGAHGVCEPAALLAAHTNELLIRKVKCKDVTLAVAQAA